MTHYLVGGPCGDVAGAGPHCLQCCQWSLEPLTLWPHVQLGPQHTASDHLATYRTIQVQVLNTQHQTTWQHTGPYKTRSSTHNIRPPGNIQDHTRPGPQHTASDHLATYRTIQDQVPNTQHQTTWQHTGPYKTRYKTRSSTHNIRPPGNIQDHTRPGPQHTASDHLATYRTIQDQVPNTQHQTTWQHTGPYKTRSPTHIRPPGNIQDHTRPGPQHTTSDHLATYRIIQDQVLNTQHQTTWQHTGPYKTRSSTHNIRPPGNIQDHTSPGPQHTTSDHLATYRTIQVQVLNTQHQTTWQHTGSYKTRSPTHSIRPPGNIQDHTRPGPQHTTSDHLATYRT